MLADLKFVDQSIRALFRRHRIALPSLTWRIVSLNVAGLLALSVGIIHLSPFRAGLIDARVQSLKVQGQIIADAIAASATVDRDSSITIDPGKLRSLQPGQSDGPSEDALYGIDFPINPERVAPILRRLVLATKTRARIYDRDGVLLVDSQDLYGPGEILRFDMPPPKPAKPGLVTRTVAKVRTWLGQGDLPLYHELGPDGGKDYEEVAEALNGQDGSKVRITDRGDVIVSVAVPVQRFRSVHGALLLSTQGADIDNMVTGERFAIFKVFLIVTAVIIVLSILLAGRIAEPRPRV
jgi:two-component system sensor histidine kinase ChvG